MDCCTVGVICGVSVIVVSVWFGVNLEIYQAKCADMNAVNAIGGSIGGTLGSSIGVSKATMQDCMRRLVKTYEESSGKSYSGDEEILDTTGMSPFDALRALIGAKIDATRKVS